MKQLEVPWAETNERFTALFEALVIGLLKEVVSISGTAELAGLSWDEVAGIQERAVKRGLAWRKKQPLQHIEVDETSFQKRHECVTVILDRQRDVLLDVLDDRKAETLEQWFGSRPAHNLASIQTLTMDTWDPFILAAEGCSPLTGTKYEWQKTSSRLDNRSRRDFMALFRLNLKTARAWRIKETSALLWNYSYRSAADKLGKVCWAGFLVAAWSP